jgi:hypothetical protein
MKKATRFIYYTLIVVCSGLSQTSFSQNVGIGTNNPNSKAILEIKATDKGILFPRLTTAQRNAITNPPNGLQIFNTDERCVNYYDSVYAVWNCYCAGCQTVIIDITDDICNVDFYNQYAKYAPAKKYILVVHEDVYIHGCNAGDTALSFNNMPTGVSITINNYGFISGGGGKGGAGKMEQICFGGLPVFALPGAGGAAISTKTGIAVSVNNYAVVAGGGGGGAGSSGTTSTFGGGGGGGAGLAFGTGGAGGGAYTQSCGQFGCTPCAPTNFAQPGNTGTNLVGGTGGAGYSGAPAGANGGGRGQVGQSSNMGAGGAAGKAITGGSGNVITNIGTGQTYGIVD